MTSADQTNPLVRVLAILKSANEHKRWRQFDEAERLCRDAIEIARTELGEDHHAHGTALCDLGYVLAETDRSHEAREAYSKALDILVKTVGNNDSEVLWVFAHLHDLYR